jgi:hypothetical protein
MPNTKPEIPVREISTDWGTVYAGCTRPDKLWISTRHIGDRPQSQLLIHRVAYDIVLELQLCDPDCPTSSFEHVADWHTKTTLHRLPRWGTPTSAAFQVVRTGLVPVITTWLATDVVDELRQDGAAYQQQRIIAEADQVEDMLTRALRRTRQLRDATQCGEVPDDREVTWLHDVQMDRVLR